MRNSLTVLFGALALFLAFGLACSRGVATSEPDAAIVDAAPLLDAAPDVAPAASFEPAPPPVVPDSLVDYVRESMNAWRPSKDEVFRTAVAYDIATVATSELSPFAEDATRAKSAILLATIASMEGCLARWVDSGLCDDPKAMKAAHVGWPGACDGGLAVSLFQIHDEGRTFALEPSGGWHWARSGEKGYDRTDILTSRQTAARVAAHLLFASLHRSGTLSGYTGEESAIPKARERLNFARDWSARHPYTGQP